jgi:cyclic dehypoxanthinyl futalosine synthase
MRGERVSKEDALALLQQTNLLDLADMANEIRYRKNPDPAVTFVADSNPNYTNICTIDCIFCAFYRHPGEQGEYTYTIDEMIAKFKDSASKGVTTILLQGGVNPKLPFFYYLDLVRRTVAEVRKSSACHTYPDSPSGRYWTNCGKQDCALFRAAVLKFSRTG